MRKLLIACLLAGLVCGCGGYKKIKIILPDGATVRAEIADTEKKAEKGLMFRKKLDEGKGMLFVFEKDALRVFWMKNTLIDLDIIFITSDKKVYSVAANVPRSYVHTPDNQVSYRQGFGKYVLELPAGAAAKHNVKEGSYLEFNLK